LAPSAAPQSAYQQPALAIFDGLMEGSVCPACPATLTLVLLPYLDALDGGRILQQWLFLLRPLTALIVGTGGRVSSACAEPRRVMLSVRSMFPKAGVAAAISLAVFTFVQDVAAAKVDLPTCPSHKHVVWTNCRGAITSGDGEKYVGEFKY